MFNILFAVDNFCEIDYIVNKIKVRTNKNIAVPNGKTIDEIIKRNNLVVIEQNNLDKYDNYCVLRINQIEIYVENFDYFYTNIFTMQGVSDYELIDKIIEDHIEGVNQKFFYLLDDPIDWNNFNKIKISEKAIDAIEKGICVVLMNASMEPTDFKPVEFRQQLEVIAKNNNLNQGNFFILTGNLLTKNDPENNFTMIPHFYFIDFPNFFNKYEHNKIKDNLLNELIEKNKVIDFDKKILCYQRNARRHRRELYYEIKKNQLLKENILISLWDAFEPILVNDFRYDGYNEEEDSLIKYFFMVNAGDVSFDGSIMSDNLGPTVDIEQHKKTFMSLVSETSVDEDVLFISEKTLKPIYCLQPFIILGNVGIIKKLKEYGFKTFDKWWDESYDDIPVVKNRIHKILSIVEYICNKSDEELKLMLKEMEEILIHNFNILTDDSFSNYYRTLNKIGEVPKKIELPDLRIENNLKNN
jgi:hypothetical protein